LSGRIGTRNAIECMAYLPRPMISNPLYPVVNTWLVSRRRREASCLRLAIDTWLRFCLRSLLLHLGIFLNVSYGNIEVWYVQSAFHVSFMHHSNIDQRSEPKSVLLAVFTGFHLTPLLCIYILTTYHVTADSAWTRDL